MIIIKKWSQIAENRKPYLIKANLFDSQFYLIIIQQFSEEGAEAFMEFSNKEFDNRFFLLFTDRI